MLVKKELEASSAAAVHSVVHSAVALPGLRLDFQNLRLLQQQLHVMRASILTRDHQRRNLLPIALSDVHALRN